MEHFCDKLSQDLEKKTLQFQLSACILNSAYFNLKHTFTSIYLVIILQQYFFQLSS